MTRPTVEVPSIPEDVYHPVDHRASPKCFAPRPFTSFVFDAQTDAFLWLDLLIKSNTKESFFFEYEWYIMEYNGIIRSS